MAKSRAYDETLKETLGDPAVFLLALKDVANIHDGVAKVVQAAKLNRESMYRMLSENGKPTVNSLNALLRTLGLRLLITPDKSRPASTVR